MFSILSTENNSSPSYHSSANMNLLRFYFYFFLNVRERSDMSCFMIEKNIEVHFHSDEQNDLLMSRQTDRERVMESQKDKG